MSARIGVVIASGVAILGLALWARYGLIEPEAIVQACITSTDWHCTLRDAIVMTFNRQQLGYAAVAAAMLALIPTLRLLAWLGWAAGLAGLVLYSWDFAAPGAVLSLLILARPANASNRDSTSQA